MPCQKLVIPGHAQRARPEVAGPMARSSVNPESITPAPAYGFLVPRCARPRNDEKLPRYDPVAADVDAIDIEAAVRLLRRRHHTERDARLDRAQVGDLVAYNRHVGADDDF